MLLYLSDTKFFTAVAAFFTVFFTLVTALLIEFFILVAVFFILERMQARMKKEVSFGNFVKNFRRL